MTATDEKQMYFAATVGSFDTTTTYVRVPEKGSALAIVCDGEEMRITWNDLFRLLKWAYGQWGGGE